MMFETRKILGDESIAIYVTCARVPVRNSTPSPSRFRRASRCPSRRRASCWRAWTASTMVDDPPSHAYPTALSSAGRTTSSSAGSGATRRTSAALCLWVVPDNLLKGAATNAVQIAEVLHERGLIRSHAPV